MVVAGTRARKLQVLECFSDYARVAYTLFRQLHFASTSEGEEAYEFERVGGIYTRVSPIDSMFS
jgi:hypothetical protein